jgi:regulatory protein
MKRRRIQELKDSDDALKAAKQAAYKLLSFRGRSKSEMIEKLLDKGFDSDTVDVTLQFLEQTGLINDRALANQLSDSLIKKGASKFAVKRKLFERGVDKTMAEETANNISFEMELTSAESFLNRKLNRLKYNPNDPLSVKKAANALQRRGFSYEAIQAALKKFTAGHFNEEMI